MRKKSLWWIVGLLAILALAGFIYFWKLGEIPSGFYVDEATIAYNAISILETGRDEYGKAFPLAFRLMGSYSPPLFIYLAAVLVRFFGSEVVVFRAVSAISVLLSVVVFYLLARRMAFYKLSFSYWAITLFYAILPWLVFNARLGYETTFGFALFNLGAYFLFLALERPKNLIAATVFFSTASYTSYNQRLLGPVFLVAFVIFFRKIFLVKKNLKILLAAGMVGLVMQIPNLTIIATPAFWTKSNQFNLNYFWTILTYLSPKILFYENLDIDLQRTIPKLSFAYNWMVVPYLIGVYLLIRRFKEEKYKFLLFYGLSTIIPPVFGSQFVSSQRILPFAVPLALTVGLGLDVIFSRFKSLVRYLIFVPLLGYSLLVLYSSYFVLFPKERANAWNYGYNQVAKYIKERPEAKFVVDDARNPRTYILLLYFMKIPPAEYQAGVDPYYRNHYYEAPPMATTFAFRNVEVRQIDWREDSKKDIYIVGDALAVSENQAKEHGLTQVAEFKDPLMNVIFKVFKTNPKMLKLVRGV